MLYPKSIIHIIPLSSTCSYLLSRTSKAPTDIDRHNKHLWLVCILYRIPFSALLFRTTFAVVMSKSISLYLWNLFPLCLSCVFVRNDFNVLSNACSASIDVSIWKLFVAEIYHIGRFLAFLE